MIIAFVLIPHSFNSRFHILRASTRAKLFQIIPVVRSSPFLYAEKIQFILLQSICNSKALRHQNTYVGLLAIIIAIRKQFQRYWGAKNVILQHLNSAKSALIKTNVRSMSQFFNKMMSMLESISRQYSSQIRVTSTILVATLVRTPVQSRIPSHSALPSAKPTAAPTVPPSQTAIHLLNQPACLPCNQLRSRP